MDILNPPFISLLQENLHTLGEYFSRPFHRPGRDFSSLFFVFLFLALSPRPIAPLLVFTPVCIRIDTCCTPKTCLIPFAFLYYPSCLACFPFSCEFMRFLIRLSRCLSFGPSLPFPAPSLSLQRGNLIPLRDFPKGLIPLPPFSRGLMTPYPPPFPQ